MSENSLQINLVNWFNYNYPHLKDDLLHVANERSCSIQQGRLLKRMGVKRGVSDIFLGVPTNKYHGLWIELKTPTGKLSPEQKSFIERKNMRGYFATAAYGLEQAQDVIRDYIGEN